LPDFLRFGFARPQPDQARHHRDMVLDAVLQFLEQVLVGLERSPEAMDLVQSIAITGPRIVE
jgi:hypothetical protein